MTKTLGRPEDLLPLTSAGFHILLALADGEKHGYAIMQEVAAITNGEMTVADGLRRFVDRLTY